MKSHFWICRDPGYKVQLTKKQRSACFYTLRPVSCKWEKWKNKPMYQNKNKMINQWLSSYK